VRVAPRSQFVVQLRHGTTQESARRRTEEAHHPLPALPKEAWSARTHRPHAPLPEEGEVMPSGVYVRSEQARRNIAIASRLRPQVSEDTRAKIARAGTGRIVSEETRRKLSLSKMGHPVSEETRAKLRISLKGKNAWSPEERAKISARNKGRPHPSKGTVLSVELRRKLSEAVKGRYAKEKNHNWRGGITEAHRMLRNGLEYKLWRQAVLSRDGYMCRKCSAHSCRIVPHHIRNFNSNPDLRFSIDNGATLCFSHHVEFHARFGRENNTPEQLEEFLHG